MNFYTPLPRTLILAKPLPATQKEESLSERKGGGHCCVALLADRAEGCMGGRSLFDQKLFYIENL
jgi:hypothetical protein